MQGRDAHFKEHAGYDKIIGKHADNQFTEYVVKYGGDVLVYRVYGKNGDYILTQR